MDKKINSRSSKSEILNYASYLEDQLKVYEEKLNECKNNITPQQIFNKTEQKLKSEKIENISFMYIEDLDKLELSLKEFSENYVKNLDELNLIKEQIIIEKDNLENIYKLKVEAESLFALMTAKKEIIENLDNKIKNLEAYYKLETENKENELRSNIKQIQLKAQYDRDEESIKFQNQIKIKKLELAKEEEDLKRRKEEVDKMYESVDALQAVLNMYETDKNKEIDAAVKKAREDFEKEQVYINKLKESDYEKKLAVLECEKNVIQNNNEELIVQLEHLQALLKDSNTSITEIASKTMDNYHVLKSLEDIKNIAISTANNTGNKK